MQSLLISQNNFDKFTLKSTQIYHNKNNTITKT